MNSREIVDCVVNAIHDKKGHNIVALDIREVTDFTDYIIIAEGNVDRHIKAISQNIIEELENKGIKLSYNVDGGILSEWVALDYIDVIIHIFSPSMRRRYAIEETWQEGKILELDIKEEDGDFL